jgi:hypothetical protein
MTEPNPRDPESERARKRRSIIMGLGLAAFVILVFVISIVRMGGDVANRTF